MTGLDGPPPPTTATERSPLFEQLWRQVMGHLPHYHLTQHPEEGTMSLATIEKNVRDFLDRIPAIVKTEAEKVLPHVTELADIGDEIAGSKLFQAALSVTLGPEDEAFVVGLMQRLDQAAHAVTQDVAEAAGPQPEPAPAQPAA